MFSSLCAQEQQAQVMEVLNVPNAAAEEKYLGLPTPDGHMCKGKFE
jgi:hypothetical protein